MQSPAGHTGQGAVQTETPGGKSNGRASPTTGRKITNVSRPRDAREGEKGAKTAVLSVATLLASRSKGPLGYSGSPRATGPTGRRQVEAGERVIMEIDS